MPFDRNGNADPNGDFELIDGKLCIRDGARVSFNHMFMDGASSVSRTFHDAKSEPPKTIDEALKLALSEMAKNSHTTVAELVAGMERKKFDELVAQVAVQFVSGKASEAIATQFGDELNYRVAKARALHDMAQARKPVEARAPFIADAALAQAVTAKVRERAVQLTLAADPLNDASYRHGADVARRMLAKDSLNARRP